MWNCTSVAALGLGSCATCVALRCGPGPVATFSGVTPGGVTEIVCDVYTFDTIASACGGVCGLNATRMLFNSGLGNATVTRSFFIAVSSLLAVSCNTCWSTLPG